MLVNMKASNSGVNWNWEKLILYRRKCGSKWKQSMSHFNEIINYPNRLANRLFKPKMEGFDIYILTIIKRLSQSIYTKPRENNILGI